MKKKLTNEQRAKRILLINSIRNWTLAAIFFAPVGAWYGVNVWAAKENRAGIQETKTEMVQTAEDQEEMRIRAAWIEYHTKSYEN